MYGERICSFPTSDRNLVWDLVRFSLEKTLIVTKLCQISFNIWNYLQREKKIDLWIWRFLSIIRWKRTVMWAWGKENHSPQSQKVREKRERERDLLILVPLRYHDGWEYPWWHEALTLYVDIAYILCRVFVERILIFKEIKFS